MTHPHSTIERFWEKIQTSHDSESCWVWKAGCTKDGYGNFRLGKDVDEKRSLARSHRFMWVLYYGEIPDGLQVLHTCDNPACCRPDHLFLGTQADNIKDMVNKKRNSHGDQSGEKNSSSKLTWELVKRIREQYIATTLSCKQLARRFEVSEANVRRIARNELWIDKDYTPPRNRITVGKGKKNGRIYTTGTHYSEWNRNGEDRNSP